MNRIVLEFQQDIELPSNKLEIKVEIKPMDSTVFYINTVSHLGPLRINIKFLPRCENDIQSVIARDKEISEAN